MRKKLLLTTVLLGFALFSLSSQAQVGLNFDGVNDYINAEYTPVAGNGNRTVEAWIKTTSNTGLQNVIVDWGVLGTGARFTVCMLNNKLRVEVSGSGINGNTVINDGLWHHVAVVYDTSASIQVSLYVDGVLDGSGNFSVVIGTSTYTKLRIGRRVDNVNYFNGSIDEVRIWDSAITHATLIENKDKEFCGATVGLKSYYKFNEGDVDGVNTGFTVLTDYSGYNNNGTLNNFALTGTMSNYVEGPSLTHEGLDIEVVNDNNVLTVGENPGLNISYQWYNCSEETSVEIPGAVSQDFTPVTAGNYSVEVTKNGCKAMSECIVVTNLSASDFEKNTFKLYPNPATNQVTVQTGDFMNAEITLTNITGQQLLNRKVNNTNQVTLDLDQPAGVYFVTVKTSSGNSQVMKLLIK